ncbi:hypothetical protein EJB05_49187 [Eragrostis curvula]|uniref:Uncharacterized protein n=1 Tax=Eragrostis curvula TaxID=38414 RepID=A0A5J9T3R0_9POAL|nr:hypothetical protein EJB05_49187 [Eragrostis curvula]
MAGVEAAEASSRAPAQAPLRWDAGAGSLRGLIALAADTVPCCYLGAMWVLSATTAVAVVARRAFGKDSRAMADAQELLWKVFPVAVLLRVAFWLLVWSVRTRRVEPREIGWMPLSPKAQRRLPRFYQYGNYGIIVAAFMVMFVGMPMVVLATKESRLGKAGSIVTDIGGFLYSVAYCIICIPELWIQLRATCAKLKRGMVARLS